MLNARHINLSFGSRLILNDLSLSLLPKERVALVGQNGEGKSSLLKILAGSLADHGVVEVPKQARIGFLQQIPDLDPKLSVLEVVRAGMALQLNQIAEHQRLYAEFAEENNDGRREKLGKRIDELTHQIEQKGGFDVDYVIESMLHRLGVSARNELISTLSGGECRRVYMASILLSSPDIYLLDEPTNHLDISAIKFLVDFFSKSNAAILFVSHDIRFVDELATKILELSHGKLYAHDPPFANYLENKLIRELIDQRSLHRRERLMVGELAWLRAGVKARTTKQNARIDRAHDLIDEVARDQEQQHQERLQIEKLNAARLGSTILELKDVGAAFEDRILFKGFNLKVTARQRYGIIGPNGVGKTTLLKILSQEQAPSFGQVILGKNTSILRFDQQRAQLEPEQTLKQTLADHGDFVQVGDRAMHIASYLERYLFDSGDAERKVATLSGGEQNRLLLAKLFRKPSNCLLLDEPTNDLDVSSLAVLEDVLLNFDGVLFVVSHDRSFLDRVCNFIIAFEPGDAGSKLSLHVGNYSDYEMSRPKDRPQPESSKASKEVKAPAKIKTKRKRSFNEEREYQSIEKNIEDKETELLKLQEQVASPELARDDPQMLREKLQKMGDLTQEIERLYARWQELSDIGD